MKSHRAATRRIAVSFMLSAVVGACCWGVRGEETSRFSVNNVTPAISDFSFGDEFAQPAAAYADFTRPFDMARLPAIGDIEELPHVAPPLAGFPDPPTPQPSISSQVYRVLPEGVVPIWGPRTPDERRHAGLGEPLEGTSWLSRSHSAGAFMGTIFGATSADDRLDPGIGGIFGLRFGWDYDHHWGMEKRFGFAQMNVYDLERHLRQTVNLELGDIDLMFYPWGDSRWRPYMMMGAGASHYNFQDDVGDRLSRLLLELPFGVGVKYLYSEGILFRLDVVDNLMVGGGDVESMNNLSLALGMEFRFDNLGFAHRK